MHEIFLRGLRWRYIILPAVVALSASLAACDLSSAFAMGGRPISPEPFSHVIDEHNLQVTIKFVYKGQTIQRSWIDRCFLYQSSDATHLMAKSRWRGFATSLPDGSAVYFQPHEEICERNQLGRLVFGKEGLNALWRSRLSGAPDTAIEHLEEQAADERPDEFVTPSIYWLNDAHRPTRIELCGLSACASGTRSRVRFLSITGRPTDAAATSSLVDDVPALGTLENGGARYVGYACWKLSRETISTALRWPMPTTFGVVSRPASGAVATLGALRSQEYANYNALAASWKNQKHGARAFTAVHDVEYAIPDMREKIYFGISNWRVNCHRVGQDIQLDPGVPTLDDPVMLEPISTADPTPQRIKMVQGENLPSGGYVDSSWNEEPEKFFAEFADGKGNVYEAEAVELSIAYPQILQ